MADEEFMFGDLFATVRVQDLPASREVVAVERQENGTWRVCGSAIANTDGIAELGIEGSKTSRVYAFAIDHWGEPFTPNRTVAYGDIIRPSVFLGWLYRVTAPGVLPGEEPVWWNSTPGMPRPVGSAVAQAEMYFQPIAHGPVDIEWEEKGVGDPHWDNVVSLLHFDGNLKDETGKTWVSSRDMEYQEGFFGRAGRFYDTQYMTCTHDDFFLGGDDFTIEFYLKIALAGDYQLFVMRPEVGKYNQILIESYGGELDLWVNGEYVIGPISNLIVASEIYHIALTRKNGVVYMFCNGNLLGSAPLSNYFTRPTINLGGGVTRLAPKFYLNGCLDELRITKGVARYTENFTPPTEPFPNFK